MKSLKIIFTLVAASLLTQLMAQDVTPVRWADKRASWMQKAADDMPQLKRQDIKPVAIVRSVADKSAFQGWRMEQTGEPLEILSKESFKPHKEVILDLGDHYTGYFSFKVLDMGLAAVACICWRAWPMRRDFSTPQSMNILPLAHRQISMLWITACCMAWH